MSGNSSKVGSSKRAFGFFSTVRGVVLVVLMVLALAAWFVVMLPFVLLRCVPWQPLQTWASARCVAVASAWVGTNCWLYRVLHGQEAYTVDLDGRISPHRSFLVVCNHQAWADILVLFHVLHGRAPLGRFFLKQSLIWVPFVGLACWAMNFPFMKRQGKGRVQQDLQTAERACARYRNSPVSLINFLEGTRFSPAKHARSQSPYARLLPPKYGALSMALNTLGQELHGVLDITLAYDQTQGHITWSWLCGRQRHMHIHVRWVDIPEDLRQGQGLSAPEYKRALKAWVEGLWQAKDTHLQSHPHVQTLSGRDG